ncbi:MAG: hypothetical protein AB1403_09145 [Candidatus Riflebacteria bacterium]
MKEKTTAFILLGFLLFLDVPGLIWLLWPSASGDEEAIKIVCVVFVGGFVNFFTGLAGWRELRKIRDIWGGFELWLSRFFVACLLWMPALFAIVYVKQLLIPI